jgi:hypothetical protein
MRGVIRALGLMLLCYDFTRVLNSIGLERLVAWRAAWPELWPLTCAHPPYVVLSRDG